MREASLLSIFYYLQEGQITKVSTVDGNSTSVSDKQSLNACFPIVVTPGGFERPVNFWQPIKASALTWISSWNKRKWRISKLFLSAAKCKAVT